MDATKHVNAEHWKQVIDRTNAPGGYRWFIEKILKTRLYPKTEEMIDAVQFYDRVAVRSCHGSSKSFTSGRLVLAFLVANAGDAIVVTTAPTERQVRDITWKEIGTAHASSVLPLGGQLNKTDLTFSRKWFAKGFTARTNDLVAFQGYHSRKMFILLDEASGIEPAIWEAIETLASGGDVKVIAIGNPNFPEGPFFDCFKRHSAFWYTMHISAFDTPNVQAGYDVIPGMVTRAWVKDQIRKYGAESPIVQVRVFGNFPTETSSTLIQISWIERAREDPPAHPEGAHHGHQEPIVAGFDAARSGLDESALGIRCGSRLIQPIVTWRGMDTMQSVGQIRRHLDGFKSVGRLQSIRVDVVGIGAGVADRLKELGYPVEDINGSWSPRADSQAFNLRSEMWWGLRDKFRNHEIGGPIDELTEHELSTVRFQYTSTNKFQVEVKEKYKDRLGHSPDRADCIMYTFADVPEMGLQKWDEPAFGESNPRTRYNQQDSVRPYDDDDYDLSVPGFSIPRNAKRYPDDDSWHGRRGGDY